VTGCAFLWAVCGVRGAVRCAVLGVRAAVCALMMAQCAVVVPVRHGRAGVRDLCV
jgi:hypothetical protein